MKAKEWKDYWEIDDGVSYIPWEKLNKDIDYDELEVGGMLDEDTMPEWLKSKLYYQYLKTSLRIILTTLTFNYFTACALLVVMHVQNSVMSPVLNSKVLRLSCFFLN